MAARHNFTVTYDGRIVRDAVRAFVLRRCFREQKRLWLAEIAMLIFLGWRLAQGHDGWIEMLIGAVVLVPPALVVVLWSAYTRNSLGKLHRMRAPEARFVLDQRGIFAASDLGETLIPWDRITEVWQRPESRMIFTGPSQFITLPTRDIPEEALRFLRRYLHNG